MNVTEIPVSDKQAAIDRRMAARRRCLTDLDFLVRHVLYRTDGAKYGPFHKWMADTVGKESGTRELWLLPRDHFKTTILTIGHAVQQILRDPNVSILIVSAKDEHALLMSEEIRKQFLLNPDLRILFPDHCPVKMDDMGAKGEWTIPIKNAKIDFGDAIYRFAKGRREPTITATGIRSTQQSRHYRWGYIDDCMDTSDTTEVGLRDIRNRFKEIIPLIDRDGGMLVIGTRKHYNDIYQALMDTDAYKVYVRHGLEHPTKPCDQDECSRFASTHHAPDLKAGLPICPERMTRDDYNRKLHECEIDPKSGVSFFYHEYMNIPFSPTDRKFQPRWFQQIDDGMIPGMVQPFDPLSKWIAVDTALKEEEHPSGFDYTCIVVGGYDEHGRLYILDIARDRHWTAKKFCEATLTWMQTYGISRVITEKVADNISWHDTLRGMCRAKGVPLMLLSLTRGGGGVMARRSKFERIESIQGHFEQGRVFFRRKAENFEDAVNEFCNLRRWTNDDIADAISMFFDERVIVMPPHKSGALPPITPFRPMPFDGPRRSAAFHQSIKSSPATTLANLGEIALDGRGNTLFTQAQADFFANRPDKGPEQPRAAFRPMR